MMNNMDYAKYFITMCDVCSAEFAVPYYTHLTTDMKQYIKQYLASQVTIHKTEHGVKLKAPQTPNKVLDDE